MANMEQEEQKFDLIYIPQNLNDDRDITLAEMVIGASWTSFS